MTGVQLAEYVCIYDGFCESFCPERSGSPCRKCLHDTAWEMYILGLTMLEAGNNPLI